MSREILMCSERECKKRFKEVKNMDYETLDRYKDKCCKCGNWIIKDSKIANKTYNKISNRWAEMFWENK